MFAGGSVRHVGSAPRWCEIDEFSETQLSNLGMVGSKPLCCRCVDAFCPLFWRIVANFLSNSKICLRAGPKMMRSRRILGNTVIKFGYDWPKPLCYRHGDTFLHPYCESLSNFYQIWKYASGRVRPPCWLRPKMMRNRRKTHFVDDSSTARWLYIRLAAFFDNCDSETQLSNLGMIGSKPLGYRRGCTFLPPFLRIVIKFLSNSKIC